MDAQQAPPPRRLAAPVTTRHGCVTLLANGVATDGVTLDRSTANGFVVGASAVDVSTAVKVRGTVARHGSAAGGNV